MRKISKEAHVLIMAVVLGLLTAWSLMVLNDRAVRERQQRVVNACAQVNGLIATDGEQVWCINNPFGGAGGGA